MNLLESPFSVLAIDPGVSGAVCRLGRGGFSLFRDFKTVSQIALAIQSCLHGAIVDLAVLEHVHSMPKQGVVSTFTFGRATGAAEGALALCLPQGVRLTQVEPQAWQKSFKRAGEWRPGEEDSRETAKRLLPAYAHCFTRSDDHNSGDAVLMAVWAIRNLEKAGR